ncbi:MAG: adventurous gliding motility protein CglE [Alphaproteobacteria bacterium]|nr:adventurous gliding motility protein CglE [Alphaproteobacteria bacterium]
MKQTLLFTLLIAAPATFSAAAYAQDGVDDLDRDENRDDDRGKSNSRRSASGEIKEVTKGWYAKANAGGAGYLLDFRGFVNAGTSVGLSLGKDVLDREKNSAAVELSFYQGIHNGMHYELQADLGCRMVGGAAPCIQGDLRTYTLQVAGEYSIYPNRRFGIGLRLGGGVLFSPLLMDEERYQADVLTREWGLPQDPGYHGSPHPVGLFGPTFEYYSKLAHFSVGADIDVFYAFGFDLGLNGTGYLKYTF